MNRSPCSEGQFTADGFDYLVRIRIYEAEDGGFTVQVKPVFGRESRVEATVDWMPGTNPSLEDAKRESQVFVELNLRHVFGKPYRGEVKWYDAPEHLQRLPSW